MIPTKQTVLHNPENGKHGNCLSAVLAALLHLPIEDVPVFSAPHPKWQQELNAWLRPFGLAYLQIGIFDEWCAEVGVTGCHHETAGPTKRSNDVLHACVGIDGATVFDPHPDDTGLTEVQSSGVFIALEPWRMKKVAELEQQNVELVTACQGLLKAHRITVSRRAPDTVMEAERQLDAITSAVAACEAALAKVKHNAELRGRPLADGPA